MAKSEKQQAIDFIKEQRELLRAMSQTETRGPTSVAKSGVAGGYINVSTGKSVHDDGKVLDRNGWRKND